MKTELNPELSSRTVTTIKLEKNHVVFIKDRGINISKLVKDILDEKIELEKKEES